MGRLICARGGGLIFCNLELEDLGGLLGGLGKGSREGEPVNC